MFGGMENYLLETPNWEILRQNPKSELPAEEKAFLDGPVNTVCEMIDEWTVVHKDYDLPQEVYDFVKKEGFFSLIIPKAYGGLEFTPLGVASVMAKIGSRSPTLAGMAGVSKFLRACRIINALWDRRAKRHSFCLNLQRVNWSLVLL